MKSKKNFDRQFLLQGGRCFWHGALVPIELMTRDHIKPRAHGGKDDWSNIVLACQKCNEAKSALHVGSIRFERWLKKVMRGHIHKFIRRETFVNHSPT